MKFIFYKVSQITREEDDIPVINHTHGTVAILYPGDNREEISQASHIININELSESAITAITLYAGIGEFDTEPTEEEIVNKLDSLGRRHKV